MLKKLLLAVVTLIASMGFAFAQVDVNKADQAALDGIKGIGPATSKKILDERSKGGAFKDWPDLEKRVKGIGAKNAVKLSQAGLTVNNQPLSGAPAAAVPAAAKSKAKETADVKPAKAAAASAATPAAAPAAAAPGKPVSAVAATAKPGEKPMADMAPAKK